MSQLKKINCYRKQQSATSNAIKKSSLYNAKVNQPKNTKTFTNQEILAYIASLNKKA